MIIFKQYARNADAIGRIGEKVRAEARATGTPIAYTEATYGTDVIREYPDGRRERLKNCSLYTSDAADDLTPFQ